MNLVKAQIRPAFVVIAVLGLGACTTTPQVSTKWVKGVRLEEYKTYTILAGKIYDSESGKTDDQTGVRPALEMDVREELERRGLKPSNNNPDLTFSYVAARRLEHVGEQEWPYHEGAIDLTATDSTGRVVWSSHLQTVIDPSDKTHRHLKEAIGRAFKNYPSVKA